MELEPTTSSHLTFLNKDNSRPPRTRSSQHLLADHRQQHHRQNVDIARPKSRRGVMYLNFWPLLIPTVLTTINLVASARRLTFTGKMYTVVVNNRASVSVAVQIISVALGLIQASAVSQLFNLSTRIRLRRRPTKLGTLQFWNGISTGTIQWNLKPKLWLLLCLYVGLCAIPAAVWTGSLTPIVTTTTRAGTTQIPRYSNTTSIREWPSEIERSGPMLRNEKGFFTYSTGVLNSGLLTQSLSTATTTNGSPRHHSKFDNSDFVYVGRSYGVGASVGLVDDDILLDPLSEGYTFQETGYETRVTCSYNTSEGFFHVSNETVGDMLYPAEGYLTDSTGSEYSVYVGHGSDAIVAFGVAAQPIDSSSTTRYVGIAAGASYANLDGIECRVEMVPSTFNVTVSVTGKNITVTPLNETGTVDMEPSGNLTHVATRQIELYSNDLTNVYQSVAGNALNFSISDYRTSTLNTSTSTSTSESNPNRESESEVEITLHGVSNAFTAMLDDILVSYASAQLLISHDSTETPASVSLKSITVGKPLFIYLTFALSVAILFLLLEEVVRTRSWSLLPVFDYTDLAHFYVASNDILRGKLRSEFDNAAGVGVAMMHDVDHAEIHQHQHQHRHQNQRRKRSRFSWSRLKNLFSLNESDSRVDEIKVLLREEQEQEQEQEVEGDFRTSHQERRYRLVPV